MDNDSFRSWLAIFAAKVKVRPIILFLDGHTTHTNEDAVRDAMKECIHIFNYFSNATHLLQPLDVSYMGNVKKSLYTAINKECYANKCQNISQERFTTLLSGNRH